MLGGMFIAAWSTYAFETAVCYTSEFKNPGTDTFKAIFYSGLLCMLLYILVPFTFQGVLGWTIQPTSDWGIERAWPGIIERRRPCAVLKKEDLAGNRALREEPPKSQRQRASARYPCQSLRGCIFWTARFIWGVTLAANSWRTPQPPPSMCAPLEHP